MANNQDTFERAIFYADCGFSVIPINRNKKPIVKWAEFQKRIATREEIEEWYSKYSDAQLGIITGKISKLAIIDIDPRNGGTDELFRGIKTPVAKTGGGGVHYYFLYNGLIKSTPSIYQGIDFKAEGGLIVAPPSISDKGEYSWITDIFDLPLLPLPEFVIEKISGDNKGNNNSSNLFSLDILKGVQEGERNNSLTKYAGHLLSRYPENEWDTLCLETLRIWNQAKVKPPLTDEEIIHTFTSIKSSELSHRKVKSIKSFPPGEPLRADVAETHIKLESWDDFILNETEEDDDNWIIKDILRPGCLGVIAGHAKHGKSTLAIHILNCLTHGKEFINETKAVPVIYLNFEMGKADMRKLLKDVTAASPSGETAAISNYPEIPLQVNTIKTLLNNQKKPGVVIIDSFRGAFSLESDYENQAGKIGGILRGLQKIARDTDWTIIVIHHLKKVSKGNILDLSGSGEWSSAPDVILTWECNDPERPGELSIKGRIPPFHPHTIQLNRDTIEFLGNKTEFKEQNKIDKILKLLGENANDFFTSDEIAKETELPESSIRRYLEKLHDEGKVTKQGTGVKGNPQIWQIKLSNSL